MKKIPATKTTLTIQVLTNQLYIQLPKNWSKLLSKYTVWKYQLSQYQKNFSQYSDKRFYERLTNAYKNEFDQPFYYFTYDKPFPALYTLKPKSEGARAWKYPFGEKVEEITGLEVAPDEIAPHILLKLMMALCFYETGTKERAQRVCQSKFFLFLKGSQTGRYITAVEIKPSVTDLENGHVMTLKTDATWLKKDDLQKDTIFSNTGAYYEKFVSDGMTYLRQIRPDQVRNTNTDIFSTTTLTGKKVQANWHSDGTNFKESRSFLLRHFQERFSNFLKSYDFETRFVEETMSRLAVKAMTLPLHKLPKVQVIDNRVNTGSVLFKNYIDWMSNYNFSSTDEDDVRLSFEEVGLETLNSQSPLLALIDVQSGAFGEDEDGKPRLLSAVGINDPYKILYSKLPYHIKQSINVNLNDVEEFVNHEHYLAYEFPVNSKNKNSQPCAEDLDRIQQLHQLSRNLEVCLTEIWLKWLVSEKLPSHLADGCLPHWEIFADGWGFMNDNILLYFEKNSVKFADLSKPEGKKVLKEKFISQGEIKERYMARTNTREDQMDKKLPKAYLVFVGKQLLEIVSTDVIAMPNWPVIMEIKANDPKTSARSRVALGVYSGGVWFDLQAQRYVVSGAYSSKGTEKRGHHFYQIHSYDNFQPAQFLQLISMLAVKFVRKNQYTVLPYPFDLIRLKRELEIYHPST
jgi:hypothetical protein